ncbi:uroporphyrinogen decarboxylase family protein [Eubacteriaceae bacterium ES2]|nr:uroporphyrinogen decarboxylase family protein [Eubacteriaceae bacterium ES2]
MTIPKFSEAELKITKEIPHVFSGMPTPIYSTPVSAKDAMRGVFEGKPVWQVITGAGADVQIFTPGLFPDNVARAFVFDHSFVPGVSNLSAGKDMFGIEWEFEPAANGSMVRPGNPLLTDMNDWKEKVVWPDINTWDWEGEREKNKGYFNPDQSVFTWFFTGFYERLISFMDFENAALAMIDDEQEDAVKEFFDKLSDLYIEIIDKYIEVFPEIDVFYFHDDWGGQKETFFSPASVKELIVPYMRKVTDFIHQKGKFAELHSCGMIEKQVPNIIAAGWDAWTPQVMNDTHKLYEMYGDQLLIGVVPAAFDPQTTSEDEQRAIAREYANKFCQPEKPSMLNLYAFFVTRPFMEELYKQSRINYEK